MDAETRRKLDMTARAIAFSRENPEDSDPGYEAAVTRLGMLLERAEALAQVERDGKQQVSTASAARRELRDAIMESHVAHLAGVAELAARERPDVRKWFVMGRVRQQFGGFLTAIRLMVQRAEGQRELFARHGLSAKVLEDLKARVAEFEAYTEQGSAGRRAHINARAELAELAAEAFDVVKVLDGINRLRFAHDAGTLSEWESVSSVQAAPRPGKEPVKEKVQQQQQQQQQEMVKEAPAAPEQVA